VRLRKQRIAHASAGSAALRFLLRIETVSRNIASRKKKTRGIMKCRRKSKQ